MIRGVQTLAEWEEQEAHLLMHKVLAPPGEHTSSGSVKECVDGK